MGKDSTNYILPLTEENAGLYKYYSDFLTFKLFLFKHNTSRINIK